MPFPVILLNIMKYFVLIVSLCFALFCESNEKPRQSVVYIGSVPVPDQETIVIVERKLEDLDGIQEAQKIKNLVFKGAYIEDLSELRGQATIERISFQATIVRKNFAAILEMENLRSLHFSNSDDSDINQVIPRLRKLRTLMIESIPAEDKDFFPPTLEKLVVREGGSISPDQFAPLRGLNFLNLGGSHEDLSLIAGLVALEELRLPDSNLVLNFQMSRLDRLKRISGIERGRSLNAKTVSLKILDTWSGRTDYDLSVLSSLEIETLHMEGVDPKEGKFFPGSLRFLYLSARHRNQEASIKERLPAVEIHYRES